MFAPDGRLIFKRPVRRAGITCMCLHSFVICKQSIIKRSLSYLALSLHLSSSLSLSLATSLSLSLSPYPIATSPLPRPTRHVTLTTHLVLTTHVAPHHVTFVTLSRHLVLTTMSRHLALATSLLPPRLAGLQSIATTKTKPQQLTSVIAHPVEFFIGWSRRADFSRSRGGIRIRCSNGDLPGETSTPLDFLEFRSSFATISRKRGQ